MPKKPVIAVVFPQGMEEQHDQIAKWAEEAGMTKSKYMLILAQKHLNEGKPLRVV